MYDLGQHIKLRDDYRFSSTATKCGEHYPDEVFYVRDKRLETDTSPTAWYKTGWYYHIELVDGSKKNVA